MENAAAWSPAKRVAFRFLFLYLLLYIATTKELGVIALGSFLYLKIWLWLVPWVAVHVLHVSVQTAPYFSGGSGDTTFEYVSALSCLMLAAVAAAGWTLLDRKNLEYARLHGRFRVLVRYSLAFAMFMYGIMKVFPLQFGSPGFERWLEPFGYFSPMGVLWSFMGVSPAYTMLSGAAELTAALLLISRRTATLGALICFAVMFNVAALNYCYDVTVKLLSTHLLLLSVFLLAPEVRRLVQVFADPQPAPRLRRWVAATRWIVIGILLAGRTGSAWVSWQRISHAELPPLYGIYDVEKVTRNGKDVPLVISDAPLWRKVAIQRTGGLFVQTMDDTRMQFATTYDAPHNTVALGVRQDVWKYTRPDERHVVLEGALGNDSMVVRLRAADMSRFLLVGRGFHWIQEVPFNR